MYITRDCSEHAVAHIILYSCGSKQIRVQDTRCSQLDLIDRCERFTTTIFDRSEYKINRSPSDTGFFSRTVLQ